MSLTAEKMRAIVERHESTNEFDVKEDPNPEAHADRGDLLNLLRRLVRDGFILHVASGPGWELACCRFCGSHTEHSDGSYEHATDCPAPALEALR